ncbi:hypothetical protein EYD45_07275 [Hyunsoonleella flava]|uniref:tRNA_anti-like n=1 Tax=Hyunsoonleella flava TaxID=2527939 RepID=A0A4Q9FFJ0_9FLAO|nr:hypothetical protein [Hyunsoonleella flava]TBN04411.1 hypothetical protein EYD45_07275 [Hyunsoonleella flava]
MSRTSIVNIGLFLAVLVLAFFIAKHLVWDKPDTTDLSYRTPVYKLDAETVINFIQNEDSNNLKAEQVIEVEGVVKKITYLNNRITILLGADGKENAFVICDMESNQAEKVANVATKDTITLKGVFKGVLEDAIFLNCIISE